MEPGESRETLPKFNDMLAFKEVAACLTAENAFSLLQPSEHILSVLPNKGVLDPWKACKKRLMARGRTNEFEKRLFRTPELLICDLLAFIIARMKALRTWQDDMYLELHSVIRAQDLEYIVNLILHDGQIPIVRTEWIAHPVIQHREQRLISDESRNPFDEIVRQAGPSLGQKVRVVYRMVTAMEEDPNKTLSAFESAQDLLTSMLDDGISSSMCDLVADCLIDLRQRKRRILSS